MTTSASDVRPVSTEELERFTRQLGVLLSTGVEMLRALDVAAQQSGSARMVATSRGIGAVMTDGREFHTALARHPDLFSAFYVQMARQGEADGVLGAALLAVADYLVREPGVPSAPTQGTAPAAVLSPVPPRIAGRPVAAPMLAIALAALGAAGLLAAEILGAIAPDWVSPLAVAWLGICVAFGAWFAVRAGARGGAGESCSLCGRAGKVAGPLARGQGISICDDCLRSSVSQLKKPEPVVAPAASVPEAVADQRADASAPPFAAEAPASQNGAISDEEILPEAEPAEKRFKL